MTSTVISTASIGYSGRLIHIECDSSNSLPGLVIVGLGNKAIEESKERIRSAIKNSGLELPKKRIILNLAPADLPKDGSSYDLPMALAILIIGGLLPAESVANSMFVGELALDGSIRPVRGIINHIEAAKQAGLQKAFVPTANLTQATLIQDIAIYGVSDLRELGAHLAGNDMLSPSDPTVSEPQNQPPPSPTLDHIYGQDQAKRALIIAAAGRHNILLEGPPGSGKTMLAKSLLSILPHASPQEVVAITKLHSLAGIADQEIMYQRPFRTPHHTASNIAVIGGGRLPQPGEVSLAHHGVLFLDEVPEYARSVLEALRQPLEDRIINIARAKEKVTYPADFTLVATRNPCPCGYLGDDAKECTCSTSQVLQYQKKVSGPLLDRIDLLVRVNRVEQTKLLNTSGHIPIMEQAMRQIGQARSRQAIRFNNDFLANTHLDHHTIVPKAKLAPPAKNLLDQAATKLDISARAYIKIIRVARTIADLEDCDSITPQHIAEALQFRQH